MARLTESLVESAVLAWLEEMGYGDARGPAIAADAPPVDVGAHGRAPLRPPLRSPRSLAAGRAPLRPRRGVRRPSTSGAHPLRPGPAALPGLTGFRLLHGIKGIRRGRFAALWTYESRQAREQLWGPPDQPLPRSAYPASWHAWEETLRPFLDPEPHQIAFTVYEEFFGG